jgi:hypothetical protein
VLILVQRFEAHVKRQNATRLEALGEGQSFADMIEDVASVDIADNGAPEGSRPGQTSGK